MITHLHIEATREDRIAIRLEANEVRVDALLTRETSRWTLRYRDPLGASHEVDLSPRRMPWSTALRLAALCGRPRKWQVLFALPERVL